MKLPTPRRIGLESVKANAVPMVVLWCVAVSVVVAYYRWPVVASLLKPFEKWQSTQGEFAAFANRVVFCGSSKSSAVGEGKDL